MEKVNKVRGDHEDNREEEKENKIEVDENCEESEEQKLKLKNSG